MKETNEDNKEDIKEIKKTNEKMMKDIKKMKDTLNWPEVPLGTV